MMMMMMMMKIMMLMSTGDEGLGATTSHILTATFPISHSSKYIKVINCIQQRCHAEQFNIKLFVI